MTYITFANGTTSAWSAANPSTSTPNRGPLQIGEPAWESDNTYLKVGIDGVTAYNSIPYPKINPAFLMGTVGNAQAPFVLANGTVVPSNRQWEPNTVYGVGEAAWVSGNLWGLTGTAGQTHTSAGTWSADQSNWTQLTGLATVPLVPNETTITTNGATLTAGKLNDVDATSGALTMGALPTPTVAGTQLAVRKHDATANTITLPTVYGAVTPTLYVQGETVVLTWDGTAWWVSFSDKPRALQDGRYAPLPPGLVLPVGGSAQGVTNGSLALTTIYGRRCLVPGNRTTISNLAIYVQSGFSGNHAYMGVYDTGDAAGAGTRTLLGAVSGSTAYQGNTEYNVFPLASTITGLKPGQQIDIAMITDNNAVSVSQDSNASGGASLLPTGALTCPGGAKPFLAWSLVVASYSVGLPSVVYETAINGQTNAMGGAAKMISPIAY